MKIDIKLGSTIDEAVEVLLNYKEKGEQVYAKFNGVELHSDTVTLDNAYIAITGLTKQEVEEVLNRIKSLQA